MIVLLSQHRLSLFSENEQERDPPVLRRVSYRGHRLRA